jgi:hypothetical protein
LFHCHDFSSQFHICGNKQGVCLWLSFLCRIPLQQFYLFVWFYLVHQTSFLLVKIKRNKWYPEAPQNYNLQDSS